MIDVSTPAHSILDAVSDALTPTPARSYVAHGPPSWDAGLGEGCTDQLTVHVPRIRNSAKLTQTSSEIVRCSIVTVVDFTATLLRCVTGLTDDGIPSAAVLDAESTALMADAAAMWSALTAGIIAGTLVSAVKCGRWTMQPMVPLGPQGGLAGWSVTLELGPA